MPIPLKQIGNNEWYSVLIFGIMRLMNSQSDLDSRNSIDKIREFVKQEEEYVNKKFDEITRLYTEGFLTIQKIDEERTPH